MNFHVAHEAIPNARCVAPHQFSASSPLRGGLSLPRPASLVLVVTCRRRRCIFRRRPGVVVVLASSSWRRFPGDVVQASSSWHSPFSRTPWTRAASSVVRGHNATRPPSSSNTLAQPAVTAERTFVGCRTRLILQPRSSQPCSCCRSAVAACWKRTASGGNGIGTAAADLVAAVAGMVRVTAAVAVVRWTAVAAATATVAPAVVPLFVDGRMGVGAAGARAARGGLAATPVLEAAPSPLLVGGRMSVGDAGALVARCGLAATAGVASTDRVEAGADDGHRRHRRGGSAGRKVANAGPFTSMAAADAAARSDAADAGDGGHG